MCSTKIWQTFAFSWVNLLQISLALIEIVAFAMLPFELKTLLICEAGIGISWSSSLSGWLLVGRAQMIE